MITPDDTILFARKNLFQSESNNFDDVCFSFFICPLCKKQIMDITLMPLVDKELYDSEDIRNTHDEILSNILDANYDFFHIKSECNCKNKPNFELRRIVFCYNYGELDYHNYLDYPFEKFQTFQFNLKSNMEETLFLFFDTETTGLPKNWKASYKDLNNWPRLVQIAWIIADINGNIVEKNTYIVKPIGFKIPKEATLIHKISNDNALIHGTEVNFVLNKFNKIVKNVDYLVAHNISYDINVISSELFRHQIDSEILEKKQICTMEQTIEFCKLPGNYGYKFPKLSELYEILFKENFEDAHDATVDINATFRCFYKLVQENIIKI